MTRRFAAAKPAQRAPGNDVALSLRMTPLAPPTEACPACPPDPSVGEIVWHIQDGTPELPDPHVINKAYQWDMGMYWPEIAGYAVADAGLTWTCAIIQCEADAEAPVYPAPPGMLSMSPTGTVDTYTNEQMLDVVGGMPYPSIVLAGVVPVVVNRAGFDGMPCVVMLTPTVAGEMKTPIEVRYFPGAY